MPHYILRVPGMITRVFSGRVTFRECLGAVRSGKGTDVPQAVWDFTEVTEFDLEAGEVRELIRELALLERPKGKIAIVAPRDHVFGMARLAEAYADIENVAYAIGVFRDLAAASEWLTRKPA